MAISLRQPIPWLIFSYHGRDPMRVINLESETLYRGQLWIFAGDFCTEIAEYVETKMGIILPKPNRYQPIRMKTNGYVGFVRATDCRQGVSSRWASGSKWNLTFDGIYPMPFIAKASASKGELFDFCE